MHTDHARSCAHDWIKLMITAARLPLRNDPANSQLERPIAHGRIWLSTWLLKAVTLMVVVASAIDCSRGWSGN